MFFLKNNATPDAVDIMSAYMILSMWLATVLMDIADDLGVVRPNPVDMVMYDYLTSNKNLFILQKKSPHQLRCIMTLSVFATTLKKICAQIKNM